MRKAAAAIGTKANRNGLANFSVVFDSNRNVVGAFAGDYQGNLWRFDLSSGDKDKWKIATARPESIQVEQYAGSAVHRLSTS